MAAAEVHSGTTIVWVPVRRRAVLMGFDSATITLLTAARTAALLPSPTTRRRRPEPLEALVD
jgi:hypothetical protein